MTPEQFHKAQNIFLQAIDINEANRAAWAEQQCEGDEGLKKHVRELLAHDQTQTLMVHASNQDSRSAKAPSRFRKAVKSLQTLPPSALLAVGALAVLLPLLLSGLFVNRLLDRYNDTLRATALVDLVDAKAAAIRSWLSREKTVIQSWADSSKVRQLVQELVEISASSTFDNRGDNLRAASQQAMLIEEMTILAGREVRFAVWDRSLITIADWSPSRTGLGVGVTPKGAERLTFAIENGATVIVMGPMDKITLEYDQMPSKSVVAALVPVRDDEGKLLGVMMVAESERTDDLAEFLRFSLPANDDDIDRGIFLFDRYGTLLYDSPYDDQLKKLGLIADEEGSYSAKVLQLRDPGVDLMRGEKPAESFASRPLTKMVRMAVGNGSGVDVVGYRDVRGVKVAGAWRWLEDYQFGVGIEVDREALEPMLWLARLQSWTMLGLIGVACGVTGYSILAINRLKQQILTAPQIGPYVLEKIIGEGGMGQVFLARHRLLKRPTAIKLLRPELSDATTIARFQREAQLAARLVHPNTVSIFDFGISEQNQFYLVMEWIDGVNLERLVQQEGRIDIDRAVSILRQIAYSIREAHVLGLIHRDLKPQNVMLTQRVCEPDVVKVLDFGLAREIQPATESTDDMSTQTGLGFVAGTPRYMAPERWNPAIPATQSIDIFAFGCIAYFMLTARHLIQGETIPQMFQSSQKDLPGHPSLILGESLPRWLDDLVASCTDYESTKRPANFDEVLDALR